MKGNPGLVFDGDEGNQLVQLIVDFFPNLVKFNGEQVRNDQESDDQESTI